MRPESASEGLFGIMASDRVNCEIPRRSALGAMQVTKEELNPCTVKLTVVCDPEQVKDGFDKAFKQIAKKIKLPGFRPGHAPKSMVEGLVDPQQLHEEAADLILRKMYNKVIEQEGLELDRTVRPFVEVTKIEQNPYEAEYTIKAPLPPQVTLGDYKGLPLPKRDVDVTDEEVEAQIDDFRKRSQRREQVTDRGVSVGDIAVVNLKVEGEEGEGHTFMIIAGQTFAQLDEAIAGMQPEEMKVLELTYPEDFQEAELAGKTVKTQVSINSLTAVQLPELDDEFAKSLQTENVQDLRNRIREALAAAKLNVSREMNAEKLLEALHERSTVYVSDNMWEALADQRLRETAQEQAQQGKSLQQYAEENGMTFEQLQQAWLEKAKLHIERALLIREVFTQEGLQLTNNEMSRELMAMAQEYGVSPEDMVKMIQQNNAVDELQFRAIARKVNEVLEANAVEVDESGEAAPAVEATAQTSTEEAPAAEEAPAETTEA